MCRFAYNSCVRHINLPSEIFLDSSMVEHSAVNRRVVGSSPTRGVLRKGFISIMEWNRSVTDTNDNNPAPWSSG